MKFNFNEFSSPEKSRVEKLREELKGRGWTLSEVEEILNCRESDFVSIAELEKKYRELNKLSFKNSSAFTTEKIDYSKELEAKILALLEKNNLLDSQQIKHAMNLAIEIHADQKPRPDGPYINHILRVAHRLIHEYGIYDPEIITSAFLHDAVEDQGEKLAKKINNSSSKNERDNAFKFINENFGSRVEKIVRKLSNPQTKKEGLSQDEKNKVYKNHVAESILDSDVLPIKLSDFSDNSLKLDALPDTQRRLKLSKKYLPVMSVFIKRLNSAQDVLTQEKINEIKEKLQKAISETEVFIKKNS